MARRAVFLDRDGTLLEHYDYLTDPDQVRLAPHAGASLRQLRERDYVLVLITNQSAVARGMITEAKLSEIHGRMKALLAREGVFLDQIYYCPFHPEGAIEKYRRESELRKPEPGMLLLAAEELDLDLQHSWMIGDDDRDIMAGQRAGCRTVLIETPGSSALVRRGSAVPDYKAVNLKEAANLVVRYSKENATVNKIEAIVEPEPETESESEPVMNDEISALESTEEVAVKAKLVNNGAADEPQPKKRAKRAKESADLLRQILRELQVQNRQHSFTEFSLPKLFAGIVQMIVLLCLGLAFYFWSDPEAKIQSVHTSLMLAAVFQTMTLTLLMMHRNQ